MAINFLSSIDIAGTASLSSVSNDNSSYTGILVWDGGLLKYRTKSQLLTDIGGDINNYVSSISFDTTNGILSLPRTGLSTLTVDLDGRYALESGNVDGSGTTNFVAKWADSNTIQNSIIFDDGTNVRINATNASVNIGTTISTTPTGGHPNTGAGTLIVAGKTNSGYNYQPGVITLINQNPSIAAGVDTGVIQFVGKDDATSGYASANIKAFTAAAAGTGNSGGGIITLGTSPGYGGPVERFRINQNGNVGIGTTSPNATLDIENSTGVTVDINSSSGDGQFRFQDNGITKWSIGRDNTQQDFVISSSAGLNTDPVIVLNHSTENVGIGTATPSEKFHVAGGSGLIESTTYADAGFTISDSIYDYRIGTTPPEVRGNYIAIKRTSSNTLFQQSSGDFIWQNVSSEKMRITSTGNVGIGTSSPSYKLDVSGGMRAGGKLTYSKSAGSLSTTGYAVAGLLAGSNGNSCMFTFTAIGNTGHYQKVVYSCWNSNGTWNTSKVIDEGTNGLDIEASANASTITFTFKSRSGSLNYSPRVTIEASGHAINNTYA